MEGKKEETKEDLGDLLGEIEELDRKEKEEKVERKKREEKGKKRKKEEGEETEDIGDIVDELEETKSKEGGLKEGQKEVPESKKREFLGYKILGEAKNEDGEDILIIAEEFHLKGEPDDKKEVDSENIINVPHKVFQKIGRDPKRVKEFLEFIRQKREELTLETVKINLTENQLEHEVKDVDNIDLAEIDIPDGIRKIIKTNPDYSKDPKYQEWFESQKPKIASYIVEWAVEDFEPKEKDKGREEGGREETGEREEVVEAPIGPEKPKAEFKTGMKVIYQGEEYEVVMSKAVPGQVIDASGKEKKGFKDHIYTIKNDKGERKEKIPEGELILVIKEKMREAEPRPKFNKGDKVIYIGDIAELKDKEFEVEGTHADLTRVYGQDDKPKQGLIRYYFLKGVSRVYEIFERDLKSAAEGPSAPAGPKPGEVRSEEKGREGETGEQERGSEKGEKERKKGEEKKKNGEAEGKEKEDEVKKEAPKFKIGDIVQWTTSGQDQFPAGGKIAEDLGLAVDGRRYYKVESEGVKGRIPGILEEELSQFVKEEREEEKKVETASKEYLNFERRYYKIREENAVDAYKMLLKEAGPDQPEASRQRAEKLLREIRRHARASKAYRAFWREYVESRKDRITAKVKLMTLKAAQLTDLANKGEYGEIVCVAAEDIERKIKKEIEQKIKEEKPDIESRWRQELARPEYDYLKELKEGVLQKRIEQEIEEMRKELYKYYGLTYGRDV